MAYERRKKSKDRRKNILGKRTSAATSKESTQKKASRRKVTDRRKY